MPAFTEILNLVLASRLSDANLGQRLLARGARAIQAAMSWSIVGGNCRQAGSCDGTIEIRDAARQDASLTVPGDAAKGKTIHIICEVTDKGTPPLARYQRVAVEIE